MTVPPWPRNRRARAPFRWDRLTALMSVVIACGALFYGVYNGQRTMTFQREEAEAARAHRRLQVRPALNVNNSRSADLPAPPGLYLENRGVGPAFVHDLSVFDGRTRVGDWHSPVGIDRLLDHFGVPLTGPSYTRFWFDQGVTIPAGETQPLLQAPTDTTEEIPVLGEMMSRKRLALCYCSLFDECWIVVEPQRPWSVPHCDNPDYSPLLPN